MTSTEIDLVTPPRLILCLTHYYNRVISALEHVSAMYSSIDRGQYKGQSKPLVS